MFIHEILLHILPSNGTIFANLTQFYLSNNPSPYTTDYQYVAFLSHWIPDWQQEHFAVRNNQI